MNLKYIYLLFVAIIFFSSCKSRRSTEVLTHQLNRATFTYDLWIDGTVEATRSVTLACPNEIDGTILFLIENGKLVKAGDTVCILENREASLEYEDALKRVEERKAEYAKSEAELRMAYAVLEAQVKTNEAQTAIANLDSVQLLYASEVQRRITQLELKKAAIEKQKLERKLKALETINKSELRKISMQIKRTESRAERIKSILDQMIIIATQDGMALRAQSMFTGNVLQEGDQIWGGMPIINIPDLTEMRVKMYASEAQFKQFNIGDKLEYQFDAMKENMAWGKVTMKAPIGTPMNRDSKVKWFETLASVDSFITLPDAGLSARCRIVIKEIKDTIVVPQIAVFDEDSMKIVYTKTGKLFNRKEIILGESSTKEAVVIAGLTGYETISLSKPQQSLIKEVTLLPDSIRTLHKKTNGIDTTNGLNGKIPPIPAVGITNSIQNKP
jgi:HlyD family secretion protein